MVIRINNYFISFRNEFFWWMDLQGVSVHTRTRKLGGPADLQGRTLFAAPAEPKTEINLLKQGNLIQGRLS